MAPATDEAAAEAVREHEGDLRALAESDLPASKWARELLGLLNKQRGGPAGESERGRQ